MQDTKTQLIKINALLENIGHQLSSVQKDPSLERKAEDIINNNISDILRFSLQLVDSSEIKSKKLMETLKKIKSKTIKQQWANHSAEIKKFVNTPEHSWV